MPKRDWRRIVATIPPKASAPDIAARLSEALDAARSNVDDAADAADWLRHSAARPARDAAIAAARRMVHDSAAPDDDSRSTLNAMIDGERRAAPASIQSAIPADVDDLRGRIAAAGRTPDVWASRDPAVRFTPRRVSPPPLSPIPDAERAALAALLERARDIDARLRVPPRKPPLPAKIPGTLDRARHEVDRAGRESDKYTTDAHRWASQLESAAIELARIAAPVDADYARRIEAFERTERNAGRIPDPPDDLTRPRIDYSTILESARRIATTAHRMTR